MSKHELPVLALRDIVVFPHVALPLYVGRARSLRAIEMAEAGSKLLFLVTQMDPSLTDPKPQDLYRVGTIARVKQSARLPDGNSKILIEGIRRARVIDFKKLEAKRSDSIYVAEVEEFALEPEVATEDQRRLMRTVITNFEAYLRTSGKPIDDFFKGLENIEAPDRLIDLISTQASFKIKDRQEVLELENTTNRLERLAALLFSETEIVKLDRKIKNRVREQIEKNQKDYYLNEQLSAIHKELGHDGGDAKSDALELEKRLASKKMPEQARQRAEREIKKLRAGAHSAESSVVRNYVELILDLPWDEMGNDQHDLALAQKILDEDHYGLKEIKERILEFLAVRARVSHHKSPLLLFVGPPGVGKTSLARSIARSLDKKFEKVSLGGMRDEAELRGHRRTYIGALPGRIISAIRRSGVSNPVILLDEIDKIGADFRGDPASALLEILDPEQNKQFNDHYLDLDYDLSKVLFISTANILETISPPLRDRMEIIRLSGYTDEEKLQIAKGFVIPKAFENHGLKSDQLELDDGLIRQLIRRYTREAGVRNLEREISKLCRKTVKKIEIDKIALPLKITADRLDDYLGAPRYREEMIEHDELSGIATGLAWTAVGGEVLNVEATAVPGKGNIQITGQLGEVMQESAKAAITYIRSHAPDYGIATDFFSTHDVHLHVPEGAIPKDGPSAGVTMTVAVLSAILGKKANRRMGMTGEVTLRGRILPIGGLKEKILGAKRAGVTSILYPFENQKDLREIEPEILEGLELHPIDTAEEAIDLAMGIQAQPRPMETHGSGQNLRSTSTSSVVSTSPIC